MIWVNTFLSYQISDTHRQDSGLAAAGTGDDPDMPALRKYRFFLFVIQYIKVQHAFLPSLFYNYTTSFKNTLTRVIILT